MSAFSRPGNFGGSMMYRSPKMGDTPLISQVRELSSRQEVQKRVPPILAGAKRLGQEDDFMFDDDLFSDDDLLADDDYLTDAELDELLAEMPEPKRDSDESDDDSQVLQGIGTVLGSTLGAFTNLMLGASSGTGSVPKSSNPRALNTKAMSIAAQRDPDLLSTSGKMNWQLAAMARQRRLSPEEAAMLKKMTLMRNSLPPRFQSRFDSAGMGEIRARGGSGGLLKDVGNFFFGADKEINRKRSFTLNDLLTSRVFWGIAGTLLFIRWMRR